VLGLGVTGGLLVWVLHDVDPAAVLAHILRADPVALAGAVTLATLTFPLRAIRWRLILRDAVGQRLPWLPLWHATAVGFMANNLLPARAGEFARAYVAKRLAAVRFTTAFGSVAVERVFDGLTLLGLMVWPLTSLGDTNLASVATAAAVVFGAALVIALAVAHRPAPWLAWLGRALRATLPPRPAERVTQWIAGLVAGLTVLKSPARFAGVVLWSLVTWLVNAGAFLLCFRAFGLALPVEAALLLQAVIGFGVAIPSSPGFFGPFEAATRVTLALYGVGAEQAVSLAVGYHVTAFVPITVLGLYSLSRAHLRLGEIGRGEPSEAGGPRGAGGLESQDAAR
jgi:glycosyltransferase 2 family protein